MQHFNQLHLLLSVLSVRNVKGLFYKLTRFSLPCVVCVLSTLMFTTIGYANASALASNYQVGNQNDWHLSLQAPTQELWQGQSSQWLLISLNPPSSKPEFNLPQTSDFKIVKSSRIAINQDQQTGWAYPVNITPTKAGTLTIPGFTLAYPEQSLTTAKQTIKVQAAQQTNKIELAITTNKEDIYIGQSIRLTTSITLDYPVAALIAVNLNLPILVNKDVSVVEPWNKADDQSNNSIGIPVNGQRQIASWQALDDNKVKIQFQSVIKPNVTGTFTLSSATLYASVIDKLLLKPKKKFKGTQYVAYYNNNFFDSVDDKQASHRVFVKSAPLTLNVKALPSSAPINFSGIVGRPIIEATATPTSVKQGEPINYSLSIVHPDIETLKIPLLSKLPSFTRSFNLPGDASISNTKTGAKVVNQSLFPRRADIQVIPEFSLSYFEPQTGLFRDLVINNVPIQVTENSSFKFSDIEANDSVSLKNTITVDEQGIWALRWQKSTASSNTASKGLLSQTGLLLILLLPPVIVAILMLKPMRNRLYQRKAVQPAYQLKQALSQNTDALLPLSRYCEQRFVLSPSQFDAINVKNSITSYLCNSKINPNESVLVIESLSAWIANYQLGYGENAAAMTAQENTQLLQLIDKLESILPPYSLKISAKFSATNKGTYQTKTASMLNNVFVVFLMTGIFFSSANNQALANEKELTKPMAAVTIEDLHSNHQKALQLDIDSPHKGNLAHAKIAQQLSTFIGDDSLSQTSLMYDIGTSWFQASRFGQSILWLRRAENMATGDEIILHNLNQARLKRLDRLPSDFAPPWLSKLHSMTSHPLWLTLCWLTYCLVWLLVWRRFTHASASVNAKHVQLVALLLSIAIFSQVARFNLKPEQSTAVVTSQEVTSRKGPGLIFSPAFTTPLHAGAELIVLKVDGQWSEVKLTNGKTCWLPSRSITNI